jgi:hypothetical protein
MEDTQPITFCFCKNQYFNFESVVFLNFTLKITTTAFTNIQLYNITIVENPIKETLL